MAKDTGIKYTVRKSVTIKQLRILDKYGLTLRGEVTDQAMAQNIFTVCLSEEKLREVMVALFEDDFSAIDIEEIDLGKVTEGWQRFLQSLLRNTRS